MPHLELRGHTPRHRDRAARVFRFAAEDVQRAIPDILPAHPEAFLRACPIEQQRRHDTRRWWPVISYRDTWRLFLRHVAARKGKPASTLGLPDLTAAEVLAFLKHTEDRENAIVG